MSTAPFYLRRPDEQDQIPRLPLPDATQGTEGSAIGITAPKLNTPRLPAPTMQNPDKPVTPRDLDTMGHQRELARLQQYGPGESGAPVHQIRSPLLRTLANIGNTAGSIVAPWAMEYVPGTSLHHQALIRSERQAIAGNEQGAAQEAETGLRTAQADEAEGRGEEARAHADALRHPKEERPTNEWVESKELLIDPAHPELGPQVAFFNKNDPTQGIRYGNAKVGAKPTEPKGPTNAFELWHAQNPTGKAEDWLKIEEASKPGTQNRYADFKAGYLQKHPKATPDEVATAFSDTQRAPKDEGVTVVDTDSGKVLRLAPGMTAPKNFRTPTQQGQVNTPTTQMRTAGARAELAAQEIPGIITEVNTLKSQLGPVAGRWNEFMQGKVGAPNPQLATLRSDLIFLSSAVALAHAVGRLPENLRAEFDQLINAPQQSPENLVAILGRVQKWMGDNAAAMGGAGGQDNNLPGGITLDEVNAEINRRKKAK